MFSGYEEPVSGSTQPDFKSPCPLAWVGVRCEGHLPSECEN